ncbi:hypothetical protein DVP82_09010, partial [Yersinia enterocolitica]|nr:hypothetical protein [Yersinia enterocolitica]EKN5941114.1 hypothetical protein [Yersinia enterocolitica]
TEVSCPANASENGEVSKGKSEKDNGGGVNQPKITEILMGICTALFIICLIVYVVGDAMKGVNM